MIRTKVNQNYDISIFLETIYFTHVLLFKILN